MAKIDHLGIAVNSIEQARRLYEALGLTVLEEEDGEEGVRSVMIPLGESRVRLLEPLDKGTDLGKFLAQHGEGLHHLALHVDDISGTFEEMKQSRRAADLRGNRDRGRRPASFSGGSIGSERRAAGDLPGSDCWSLAFSLLVYTEQLLPTRLFLKKRRTSLHLPMESRSEKALSYAASSQHLRKHSQRGTWRGRRA